jgi:hypothetical protein
VAQLPAELAASLDFPDQGLHATTLPNEGRVVVKTGKAQLEQMFSALPLKEKLRMLLTHRKLLQS